LILINILLYYSGQFIGQQSQSNEVLQGFPMIAKDKLLVLVLGIEKVLAWSESLGFK